MAKIDALLNYLKRFGLDYSALLEIGRKLVSIAHCYDTEVNLECLRLLCRIASEIHNERLVPPLIVYMDDEFSPRHLIWLLIVIAIEGMWSVSPRPIPRLAEFGSPDSVEKAIRSSYPSLFPPDK